MYVRELQVLLYVGQLMCLRHVSSLVLFFLRFLGLHFPSRKYLYYFFDYRLL